MKWLKKLAIFSKNKITKVYIMNARYKNELILLTLGFVFYSLQGLIHGQNKPFPQSLDYPNTIKPNNVSQTAMNNSIVEFYEYWKSAYLRPSNGKTPGGYFVYVSVAPGTKTVSEANGYGMIITALFAGYDASAKEYFDGMYYMYDEHRSTIDSDLMSWIISNDENPAKDEDSATDGDMDIAYALLLAHDQWGSDGAINYLAEAKRISSDGIKESASNNYRLMLGDWWDGDWQWATRSSDWMPDHLRAFFEVSNDDYWIGVADTIYSLVNQLTKNYSPTSGLMPDFVDGQIPAPAPADFLESEYDGDYNWNACRFPWRIAVDYAHYGTPAAKKTLERIVNWLENKTADNPANIKPGYLLTGEPIPNRNYSSLAFSSPFISACIVNEAHQQYLNDGWDIISNTREESYFGDTINLLCMLLISGNWWKPETDEASNVRRANAAAVPDMPILLQNYPNPFNPETIIEYHLPKSSFVKIAIYNVHGQRIVTLLNKYNSAGTYQLQWDGRNEAGQPIASGIYIYQINAGEFVSVRKLIRLR